MASNQPSASIRELGVPDLVRCGGGVRMTDGLAHRPVLLGRWLLLG